MSFVLIIALCLSQKSDADLSNLENARLRP